MRVINGYMSRHTVPFELQSRVRKYLEYTLTNESHSDDEDFIMGKLNKNLKEELLMESVGKLIRDIPFFKNNFSAITIQKLVFALKKTQLNPEEFVINVLDKT